MDTLSFIRLVEPRAQDLEPIELVKLQKMLADTVSPKWATIISNTELVMNKRDNPWHGRVRKIARTNFLVNPNTHAYRNAVNNQREREGLTPDFQPQPRTWGERLKGIPFVSHVLKATGEHKLYLEVYARKNFREVLVDLEGNQVDKEVVKPYIRKSSPPKTQLTKKPIILRDISVDNLLAITINGKRYVVR